MTSLKKFCEINKLLEGNKKVKIFLMNGFQKRGKIVSVEDDAVIFLDDCLKTEDLIYCHAISTVSIE